MKRIDENEDLVVAAVDFLFGHPVLARRGICRELGFASLRATALSGAPDRAFTFPEMLQLLRDRSTRVLYREMRLLVRIRFLEVGRRAEHNGARGAPPQRYQVAAGFVLNWARSRGTIIPLRRRCQDSTAATLLKR
jgi:hypothetical protein